eukprot:EG_transcript_24294
MAGDQPCGVGSPEQPNAQYEEVGLPQRHHPRSSVRLFAPRLDGGGGSRGLPLTPPGWLRCVLLSDTHNRHRELAVPTGDVLIHCGDFTNSGTHAEVRDFAAWLGGLPHQHKLVCGGNHDLTLDPGWYAAHWPQWHGEPQAPAVSLALLQEVCRFAEGEAMEVAGCRVFASAQQPRQPKSRPSMAFGRPRGQPLKEVWSRLPASLHVLVTHTPPHGVLDGADYVPGATQPLGDEELMVAVRATKPLVHVFGHVHGGRGFECRGR